VRSDTELVMAARTDDPRAFGALVPRWFDRCWDVAWRILHDRDLAADVAQDALLTAWRQLDRLQDPDAFGGWVLRIARNRALDRLAKERRARPTGDHRALEQPVRGDDPAGPEAVAARREEHDLVWAAAAALGERDASLLDLQLRHGLEPAEIAEELGMAPNAAHQALFRLRARLGDAVRAWLLWRDGTPACVVLRAELAATGQTRFDAGTARAIRHHVKTCDQCSRERDRVVAPAALFSAVPVVAAPAALRDRAFELLSAAGVPVDPAAGADGGLSNDPGTGGGGADGTAPGDTGPADGGADGAEEVAAAPSGASGGVPRDGGPSAATTVAPTAAAAWSQRSTTMVLGVLAVVLMVGLGWWLRLAVSTPADLDEVPAADLDSDTRPPPASTADTERGRRTIRSGDDVRQAVPADLPGDPASPQEPAPVSPDDPPAAPPSAPPPTIDALVARTVGACSSAARGLLVVVAWRSTGAATATLTTPDGGAETVPVSGSVEHCISGDGVVTLDVRGPGGTATRSADVGRPTDPVPPPPTDLTAPNQQDADQPQLVDPVDDPAPPEVLDPGVLAPLP
jgi:RNA polymerase sigma factor (sigma-70 family)